MTPWSDARIVLFAFVGVGAGCGALTGLDIPPTHGDAGTADATLDASPPPSANEAATDEGPPPPLAVGEGCSSDSECASGFCLPSVFLTGLPPRATKVCSRTCCSNSDCGGRGTCYPTAGGNFCVADAPACGAGCTACCKDGDCPSGGHEICANVSERGGIDFAACAGELPDASTDQCRKNSDCASGSCVSNRCDYFVNPCCTASDCADGLVCQWAELDDESGAVHVFRGCLGGVGSARSGSPCTSPRDCGGGACATFVDQASPSCTQPCCEDADCSSAGPGGWLCRPYNVETARVGALPFPVLVCQPPFP